MSCEISVKVRCGRGIGVPAAHALTTFRRAATPRRRAFLLALRPSLRRIGGSNARRDLFEQVLIEACIREGANKTPSILLTERIVVRGSDRFVAERIAGPQPAALSRPSGCLHEALDV